MYLLRAFVEAGVKGALFGVIYDPPLAAEAHRHGLHYHFDAHFNRDETTKFSEPWTAPARVAALSDGNCVGRRGIYAGLRLALGPCAALAIGGITVVVVSHRVQCADPVFFEMMGLDIGKARGRRGQVARPFPRRVRRILRPGPDRRGRSARPDLADARTVSTGPACRAR